MKHKKQRKALAGTEQSIAGTPAYCPECRQFVGRGYPHCSSCREVAEEPIRLAWESCLLAHQIAPGRPAEQELASQILANAAEYWWSEVEAALRLTGCPTCGGPLGYGAPACADCWSSSDMYWGKDVEFADDGTMLRNEHALRVVLRGLGQEKRHSRASLDGWRLYLPFLLRDIEHGPGREKRDVSHAQAIAAWIKAGRSQELFRCQSIEEMYALTRAGRPHIS